MSDMIGEYVNVQPGTKWTQQTDCIYREQDQLYAVNKCELLNGSVQTTFVPWYALG